MSKNGLFLIILIAPLFIFLFKAYTERIGAFGCSDQCHIFVAAYFMQKGKVLYSQIFFNHQPLMPYISFFIQSFLKPSSLYQLIMYHHIFIYLFSFFMGILLILRFGWLALWFVSIFEITKYYLHGNLFLPESLIPYLLVYMLAVVWMKIKTQPITLLDYILSGIFLWLILFLREPYILSAILLYLYLIYGIRDIKKKLISLLVLFGLSSYIFFITDVKEYFYQVIFVNKQPYFFPDGIEFFKEIPYIFLYPIILFFKGELNHFRFILISIDVIFWLMVGYNVYLRNIKLIIFIFVLLGFTNTRPVNPGTIFFEAFHILPWYGIFLMIVALMVWNLKKNLRLRKIVLVGLFGIFIYSFFSPKSFVWERINRVGEFTNQYATYFAYGETIKVLSKQNDTVFLDLWDDLIYWQSGLDSPYKYSLYIPVMRNINKYSSAREEMFRKSPPDFYYAWCTNGIYNSMIPDFRRQEYIELLKYGKPSCLFINSSKLANISHEQWEKIKRLEFSVD